MIFSDNLISNVNLNYFNKLKLWKKLKFNSKKKILNISSFLLISIEKGKFRYFVKKKCYK
jgi:hypothetical protein